MFSAKYFIELNTTPKQVFSALTSVHGLKSWWTEDTALICKSPKTYSFSFTSGAFNKMQSIEEKPFLIEWVCIDGDPEWVDTRLTFEIIAPNNDCNTTKVRFTHGQWEQNSDYLALCNTFWGYYLFNLKKYLEEGKV